MKWKYVTRLSTGFIDVTLKNNISIWKMGKEKGAIFKPYRILTLHWSNDKIFCRTGSRFDYTRREREREREFDYIRRKERERSKERLVSMRSIKGMGKGEVNREGGQPDATCSTQRCSATLTEVFPCFSSVIRQMWGYEWKGARLAYTLSWRPSSKVIPHKCHRGLRAKASPVLG